jgi:hypothetical protein
MEFLSIRQFEAYVAACASRGVAVVWDDATATPRTDNKTIWIPRITSKTSAEQIKKMRMFIKHETSHCVDSDFEFLKMAKVSGFLALVNNMVEDYRIDFRNDAMYAGDVRISEDYYDMQAQLVTSSIKENPTALASLIKVSPLFAWDAENRGWISSAHLFAGAVRSVMAADPVALSRYNKLREGTYTADLIDIIGINDKREASKAVLALAKRIVTEVFEEDATSSEGDAAEAEGGAGSGKGKGEGEESAGSAGEGEGESSDDKTAITDEDIINVSILGSTTHDPNTSRVGTHVTDPEQAGKRVAKGWVIPPFSEYVVLRGDTLPHDLKPYDGSGGMPKVKIMDAVDTQGKPLATHLRMKLQTRSRDRYMPGMRKGKVHNGSLHRLLSGNDKQAERVFKTKVVSDTLDTAVLVLIDCSGSMGGIKFDAACATAITVSEALRPIGIKHSLLGFTSVPYDSNDQNLVRWFKDWDERVTNNQLFSRFDQASGHLTQNADGDALMYAYASLLQRKEHRKMLVVLSDGSPCGRDWAGNGREYLKDVVRTIIAHKQVDLYGIGILDDNVSHYYPKHSVLKSLDSLAPAVLSVLDI